MSLVNIEKTIELDVYDHDTTPSVIKAIQMDEGTRTVFAMIQSSRQDYDIGQNAEVKLTVLRPDKTRVQIVGQPFGYNGADGTMYGAKADLSDVALAVKGTCRAQFKMTSGEQELRTEIFTISNGEALDAGDGDWAGDLDGHNLDEMAQDIEDTKAAVSEMESDVSDLKSGLSDVEEDMDGISASVEKQINDAIGIVNLTDKYANGFIATNQSAINMDNTHPTDTTHKYQVVECTEGDVFEVKGSTTSSTIYAVYCWVKEDRTTKISYSGTSSFTENTKIVAPAEAKYLISNVLSTEEYTLTKGESVNGLVNNVATTLESLNLLVDKNMSNGYITATGSISSSLKGDKVSDFIPVSEGDVLNIRAWGNPASGDKIAIAVSLFDSSKAFISRPVSTEGQVDATYMKITYTVPSGTSYIRTGSRWYGKMMVTKGDFDMAFLPSSDDIATVTGISDIADGTKRLRNEVDGITENIIYTEGYEDGYITVNMSTIDVTKVILNYEYKHIVLDVSTGDIFNIIGHSGATTIYGLYCYVDANGNKIAGEGVASYDTYKTFRVPTGAVKLVSNVRTDYPYSLVKGALIGAQVKSLSNALSEKTGVFNPLLCPASPKFVMHRGLSTEAPENTVPAFELAGQGGAWGIETDVYETTDGYFVLSHDNDVSRMTDGTGKITEMTYAQTQECTIDAGNNIEQYPNLKMPLLEEYLGICRRYGVVPCIELKDVSNYTALVNVIRKCGMEGSSVFTFYYDVNQITEIRQLTAMPILVIGALTSDINDLIDKAQTFSDLWLSLYNTTVTKEVIEQAHQVNVPVGIWAVDNAAYSDTRFRWGVDFIVSNSITKFNT